MPKYCDKCGEELKNEKVNEVNQQKRMLLMNSMNKN